MNVNSQGIVTITHHSMSVVPVLLLSLGTVTVPL
jgi:hypothetical protein